MSQPSTLAYFLTVALIAGMGQASFGQEKDDGGTSPLGFTPASRAEQARAEALAIATPTPENARSWLRTLTEEPHAAGTFADKKTALFVFDKLKEWGWQVDMAEYEVLLNYPAKPPTLALIQPNNRILSLVEDSNLADKDSASPDAFPAFHGYGVSGTAQGQVVYANHGRPEDYATLEKLGVDVRDKIVLVRYGEIFRGLKVRNAQKRGAKGILIFSDPADDGYGRGDVYPNGPFRSGSSLQRGSVQFLSLGPGDPSTPNGPSLRGAKRLPFHPFNGFPIEVGDGSSSSTNKKLWEKETGLIRDDYYASIPSLPISYDAARPILEALGGPNVPAGWQGGLPFAYHVGPGPAEVSFSIQMDYAVRTIWNVIATIKGDAEPNSWVMIGNHRDAWVYGAVDPGSGTATTLETCRAIGAAVKAGWKPRRTLVYASWDAEEYGLVGSTEWADEHAKEIDSKALMMLNVDSAVSGNDLDMDGVPSLRDLMLDSLGAITDIRTGKSLKQIWTDRKRSAWAGASAIDTIDPLWDKPAAEPGAVARPQKFSPQLNPLGSGSDYTAFLDHLGIPAVDVGFGGKYGVYHSVFDNFYWMEKFCDPEFLTHVQAARLYTVIAMRAAAADVAPLKFVPYGEALRENVDDLRRIVERKAKAPQAVAGKTYVAFDGLETLVKSVKGFQAQAALLDQATKELASLDKIDPVKLSATNEALKRVERAFLLDEGLPSRPWFKHAIYAPGLTTGYASWPLPGVRQSLLDNDAKMLAAELPKLVARIDAASLALKTATTAAKTAIPAQEEEKEEDK